MVEKHSKGSEKPNNREKPVLERAYEALYQRSVHNGMGEGYSSSYVEFLHAKIKLLEGELRNASKKSFPRYGRGWTADR